MPKTGANQTQLNSTQLNSTQLNSTQLNSTQLNTIMTTTTTYSISISKDNIWAGSGKYDHTTGLNDSNQETVSGNIRDCAARLEDGAYEAIENAITDMDTPEDGEVEVNGKTYGWTLELDEEEAE